MARTDTGQGGQSLAGKILDAPLWSTLFGAHAFLNVYCTPCNDMYERATVLHVRPAVPCDRLVSQR
jgi:hypothetical protein